MEGYKTLKAGQPVTFEKQPSGKGIHAVNICALETAESKSAETCLDDEIISVEEETMTAKTLDSAETPVMQEQASAVQMTI